MMTYNLTGGLNMHIARAVGNCWSGPHPLESKHVQSLASVAAAGIPPRLYSFINESLSRLIIDEIRYYQVPGFSDEVEIEILGLFVSARVGEPFEYGFMWWVRAWDGNGTQYLGAVYLGLPMPWPLCVFGYVLGLPINPKPVVESLTGDSTGIARNAAFQ